MSQNLICIGNLIQLQKHVRNLVIYLNHVQTQTALNLLIRPIPDFRYPRGFIGAIDEKTNKLVLRVGSETYAKTEEGNFETKTDWINCYVALSEKGRYRVGDRYFFRGNMIVEPYVSKKEEGVAKAQIKVFVSEKPELIYRKKDTAPVPAAPAEPCDDVDDLPF